MNKEVIYIDVDDDITAIVGKVKATDAKVIALVPPKRIGVLQSAVNLRILQRVAKVAGKHVVLITNDQALTMLAGGADIPVAKNLQSKPEKVDVPALKVDGEDDIIDGAALPVDEYAHPGKKRRQAGKDAAVAAIAAKEASPSGDKKAASAKKASPKVPNFNKFRKKLFIGTGAFAALIIFLVWALKFAPHATVVVTAKTSAESVATTITLAQNEPTQADKSIVRAVTVEDKKETAIEFAATGKREEGEKASGTLTLSSTSPASIKVPVGTGFSNGNCTFTTTTAVEVPGVSVGGWTGGGFGFVAGKVDVAVKATQIGEECNLSPRAYDATLKGVKAVGSVMKGGSKREVTFVTQADVQKATEKIAENDVAGQKNTLRQKLGNNVKVIEDSFTVTDSKVEPTPQVGKEAADGKAKLVTSVSYSMSGVASDELQKFLDQALVAKFSKETDRRVYDSGLKQATVSEFKRDGDTMTARVTAKGQVGPKVTDEDIIRRVKGKRFGEIQADLKSIEGVSDVEVKLSPFWVTTVPKDDRRVAIQFNVNQSN